MAGKIRQWWQYAYATQMPTPGAMAYGLVTNRMAPRPWIGPAIGYAMQTRIFNPQDVQGMAAVTTTGLGGLAQGQMQMQPLSDPYEHGELY